MIDEQVTPNFWLSEFLNSETATRRGISNVPGPLELANLRGVLIPGMQAIRQALGRPISVSSGYRSPALNRSIGGAKTSQHVDGLAADFTCPAFGSPLKVARFLQSIRDELRFRQLIFEGTWVHVGFPPSGETPRMETLTAHFGASGVTYSKGIE